MKRQILLLLVGLSCALSSWGAPPALPTTATTVNEGYEVSWDPNPASDDYMPTSKAFVAALAIDRDGDFGPGNPRGYHEGYTNFLFAYPYFSEQPKSMYIYDCKTDDGCDNGLAPVASILMPTTVYADVSDSCIGMIVGHELFHHVEFAYANLIGGSGCGGIWGNTACEGQARALQDKIFTTLDLFPVASCVAPYLGQVNGYLADTNQSIWLASYDAALWWTYLTEQYGINATEPGLGVDFLTLWWGRAVAAGLAGADAISITDATIKLFEPADNVFSAFRHFAIANLVKDFDLSGSSAAFVDRYSYRDEDPLGGFNLMNYNNVKRDFSVGPIGQGQEVTQLMGVQYFGSRVLKADISSCPANRIIKVEIDAANTTTSGADNLAGYGVIFVRDNQPQNFYKKFDVDWTVTTFQPNNRFDDVYLVVAPIVGFWAANVTVSCQAPETTFDVDFPVVGPAHPSHGGNPGTPGTIAVAVAPTTTGVNKIQAVSGLTALDFSALVGGKTATVLEAVPDREGYMLQIQLPAQEVPGSYDLEVSAGEAVQTASNAVVYGDRPETEVILAIDTSTSMLMPPDGSRLAAVRSAGVHFFDQLAQVSAAGLVDFRGDSVEPNSDGRTLAPLLDADAVHLDRIRIAIGALSSGARMGSAIADGLSTAYQMFLADGNPVRARHTVLIVDGPENEADFWFDVRDEIISSGMTVHTVALGPLADQALLAEIARATGGEYRYADVLLLETDVLDLHAALGQIADVIEGRRHTQYETPVIDANETLSIDIPIDSTTTGPAVIAARESTSLLSPPVLQSVRLFRPDGSEVLARDGDIVIQNNQTSLSFLGQLAEGTWRLQLAANANADNTPVDVAVSIPDSDGLSVQTGFFLPDVDDEVVIAFEGGQSIGVAVSVADGRGLQTLAQLQARVVMPDGQVQLINVPTGAAQKGQTEQIRVADGSGPRSVAFQFMTSTGSPSGYTDDGVSGARGSYYLRLDATLEDGRQLIAHEVVHVGQAQSPPDRDADMLPDGYEDRHACLNGDVDDASQDGDIDLLTNLEEYQRGTQPCRADSDDGGETDGSEVARGRNPLDAKDDILARPLDGYVVTQRSEHEDPAPLTANAVTIKLPGRTGYANLTLKRGVVEDALQPLVALDAADTSTQEYVDSNVTIGREYFYQFQGSTADGALSAPGRVFSGFALADSNAPLGAVNIAGYQLRTDGTSAVVENSLYNEPPERTEYRRRLDDDAYGPWLSYIETWTVQFGAVLTPQSRTVTVQYRDADGNVSTAYRDDIVQYPVGSLGAIAGRVTLSGGGSPRGILVEIVDGPMQKPALTDANGDFVLAGLEPGTYSVGMTRLDYEPQFIGGAVVSAGDVNSVADMVLQPVSEFLFGDGFETP